MVGGGWLEHSRTLLEGSTYAKFGSTLIIKIKTPSSAPADQTARFIKRSKFRILYPVSLTKIIRSKTK